MERFTPKYKFGCVNSHVRRQLVKVDVSIRHNDVIVVNVQGLVRVDRNQHGSDVSLEKLKE